MRRVRAAVVGAAMVVSFALAGQTVSVAQTPVISLDPEKGSKQGSPLDDLPDHIRLLEIELPTGTPQRADWSPDGERLIFLDAPVGDVWEYDVDTGALRDVSSSELPGGVLRAHHLTTGDIVACAPQDPNADNARFNGMLWVLPRPLGERPAVPLDEACWEGVAVSKQPGSTRIAWNRSTIDFTAVPDVFVEALVGESRIFTGRIVYEGDTPVLVDRTEVLDKSDVSPDTPAVEAQDFRQLDDGDADPDDELVFSAYFHKGGQTMGVDLDTGEITDFSPTSLYYEEAEGIDPDGSWVLVERDLAIVLFPGELDIWRLILDGSGEFERLTTFNHHVDHGATNPVVSPDGTTIAFQLEKAGSEHGQGHGLLLFDLAAHDGLDAGEHHAPPPADTRPAPSPPVDDATAGDAGQAGAGASEDDDTPLPATGPPAPVGGLALLAVGLATLTGDRCGRRRRRTAALPGGRG